MFRGITRGGNEKSTENRVDPADHLQVILAMATVPLPSRRPNEAERVDSEEDRAECNQSNLEEFFARNVVHGESPVRKACHDSVGSLVSLAARARSHIRQLFHEPRRARRQWSELCRRCPSHRFPPLRPHTK